MTSRVHPFWQMSIAVLLALVLAMRVVAHPLVLSAPAPGLVALCSNGEIVYYSMETGLPVESEAGDDPTKCPYAGALAATNAVAPQAVNPFYRAVALAADFEATQVLPPSPQRVRLPRAPPA